MDDAPTRQRDTGALLIGVWFAAVGVIATIVGADGIEDVPVWLVPVTFAVTGLGLLLPKRR